MSKATELLARLKPLVTQVDQLEGDDITKRADDLTEVLSALSVELRDVETREELQDTELPDLLRDSLKFVLAHGSSTVAQYAGAAAANFGADDLDRLELLFQSELPSLFIQLLQDELQDEALFVSPSAQRTMTAFLLNAVITGHENTKTMLGSPEFLGRLLELSYRFCTTEDFSEMDYMTCIACTEWIWHIIAEVSATCPRAFVDCIDEKTMGLFVYPLELLIPRPRDSHDLTWHDFALDGPRNTMAILEHMCMCLHNISIAEKDPDLPDDDIRVQEMPANSMAVFSLIPEAMITCLDFIEYGKLPSRWDYPDNSMMIGAESREEPVTKGDDDKVLMRAKASLVEWICNMAWAASLEDNPALWFRVRQWLVDWDRDNRGRDDLAQFALVCLGNTCRNEQAVLAMLSGSHPLIRDVWFMLSPSMPVKILNGVIGLIRNMAVNPASHEWFADNQIIEKLADLNVFSKEKDMVSVIAGQACGLLRRLCLGSLDISLSFVNCGSIIDPLVALYWRTDEMPIAFEASRVFAAALKTLSSGGQPDAADSLADRGRLTPIFIDVIRRAGQHILIMSDAILALCMIVSNGEDSAAEQMILDLSTANSRDGAEPTCPLGDEVLTRIVEDKMYSEAIQSNVKALRLLLDETPVVPAKEVQHQPLA